MHFSSRLRGETSYYYGVLSYKVSHAAATIISYVVLSIWVLSFQFMYQSSLLWLQRRYLVANQGGTAYQCLSYLKRYLTCRKILQVGVIGFTLPLKEAGYGFLSPLKLCRPQPDLGTNGNHTNHYTTEGDYILYFVSCTLCLSKHNILFFSINLILCILYTLSFYT
jgi:hypothetical protein